MTLRYPTSLPQPAPAAALLALLLGAAGARAQSLYTPAGATLVQSGDLYNQGTVRNLGTYLPAAGTLLVAGGDFYNSGTIGTNAATGTLKLLEPSATQAHTLTLGGQTLPNLTLDVPAGTTLGSSGTLTGTLTLLGGHLATTPDYTLTLGPAATLAGETNAHYVKGRVAQQRALGGTTAVDYAAMGTTINPNGNSLTLAVERRAGMARAGTSYGSNPGMASNQSIDRIWALSSSTATSASPVTLTLAWLSDNDNNLSFAGANAQVWRSDDNGSTWQRQGAVQDGSQRSVTVSTTSLNALYTVSTTAAPLPAELVAFGAQAQGPDGLLSWQTASELHLARFEVQASTDGATWAPLGQVAAAGSSATTRAYQYRDANLSRYGAPTVYYRLRQVDTDGSSRYSAVATLAAAPAAWQLTAYPNPYATTLTAALTTPEAGPLTLTLLDATGRVVLRRQQPATAGSQVLALPEAQALPSGSYLLQVQQAAHAGSVRVVRQ